MPLNLGDEVVILVEEGETDERVLADERARPVLVPLGGPFFMSGGIGRVVRNLDRAAPLQ